VTLDNLIGISLEKITPHKDAINRLLHAAERNIVDYSGDIIPESTLITCIANAEALLTDFKEWLRINDRKQL
jgi:glucose-6-phosphate dehydrogenase assembly protein OpcA